MSDKRKRVLNQNKNISKKVIFIGAIICSILIFVIFSMFLNNNNRNKAVVPSFTSRTTVSANNGVIKIALKEIDNKARFYRYKFIDKDVDFFLLKSNDGVIRAALDACDVCFRARKGYKQDGDYMICNNCGQTFASSRINEIKGGCNPSPLERNIVGDNIEINVSDLFQGKILF